VDYQANLTTLEGEERAEWTQMLEDQMSRPGSSEGARKVVDIQEELVALVCPLHFINSFEHGLMSCTGFSCCPGLCSRPIRGLLCEPIQLSGAGLIWLWSRVRGDAIGSP
jgi:hypothetical protein